MRTKRAAETNDLVTRWGRPPLAELAADAVRPFVEPDAPAVWDRLPRTEAGKIDLRGLMLEASLGPERLRLGGVTIARLRKRPDVSGKILRDLDLSFARIPSLCAVDATFERILFDQTVFSDPFAPSAVFRDVVFKRIQFNGVLGGVFGRPWDMKRRPEFTGCTFEDCRFRDAQLWEAVVKGCTFTNCRWRDRSRFEGVSLVDCLFRHCRFDEVVFSHYCVGRRINDGEITACNFDDCSLIDCGFYFGIKLSNIRWSGNEVLVVPERYEEFLDKVVRRLGGSVPRRAIERYIDPECPVVGGTTNMTTMDGLPVPDPVKPVVWKAMKKEHARMFGQESASTRSPTKAAPRAPRPRSGPRSSRPGGRSSAT